jgi:hypothetical protein
MQKYDEIVAKVHTAVENIMEENGVDTYMLTTGVKDNEKERIFATASVSASAIELIALFTELFLSMCQNSNENAMRTIVAEAYRNALQLYEEGTQNE